MKDVRYAVLQDTDNGYYMEPIGARTPPVIERDGKTFIYSGRDRLGTPRYRRVKEQR